MEWIIGRKEGQFIVNHSSVSGKHARLTRRADNTFLLEDLNSTNGTYVNGVRIVSKSIQKDDQVYVAQCSVDLSSCFSEQSHAQTSGKNESAKNYSREFARLKQVYLDYNRQKIEVQSRIQSKVMLMRSLPMAIPAILTVASAFIEGKMGFVPIIGGILSLIGLIWGIQAASKEQSKVPALMQEIEDQFKIDYVCPHCKGFLGNLPWENIYNRGCCSYGNCKAKFKE